MLVELAEAGQQHGAGEAEHHAEEVAAGPDEPEIREGVAVQQGR
jgi:hypothetical protein